MRAVHASSFVDRHGREPAALLEAWPTLALQGPATASPEVEIIVVQAAAVDADVLHAGLRYRFVREHAPGRVRRRLGHWAAPLTRRLTRTVAELDPDIVHIHSLSFPRHVRELRAKVPHARIVVQDHADHPIRGWRRHILRARLSGIDAVAFTSAAQAGPFLEAGILDAQVRVFAVPESSSRFTPGNASEARDATGIGGDPCVLWLGHLDANKDPMAALDAIRESAAALPGLRFWMCYLRAPLLDAVRRRIENDAVLRARVRLLGPQPHARIETLLRAADFLLQASHSEGSGYAVIEALACGTTPIVTDIPSFRALSGDGAVAVLSPVGDASAMAASLVAWAALPAAERRARARTHFERDLSFAAIGERWRSIYREMLGR
jgi:glycosyltransferase involved in cell wall biosynthesis